MAERTVAGRNPASGAADARASRRSAVSNEASLGHEAGLSAEAGFSVPAGPVPLAAAATATAMEAPAAAAWRDGPSPALDRAGVLGLQRTAGNAATVSVLQSRTVAGSGSRPAVQRQVTDAQAGSIAGRLHEAMEGWGTDEEAIYGALSGRTSTDLDAIRTAYRLLSPTGLDADLADELTDDEMARVRRLMEPAATPANDPGERWVARKGRAREVAEQVRDAMAGWGTEEDQIFNALSGRTQYEVVEIASEFATLTGHAMLDDLRDELSGDDLERALGLARAVHREGEGPDPEIAMIQQSVNALGAAPPLRVTGMYGPETTAAVNAFQTSHAPLRADGVANLETWLTLDRLVPRVFRQDRMVAMAPGTAEARGVPQSGTAHPTVQHGSNGAAVEELQQKLLTIDAAQVPTRPTANGAYNTATRNAVREFQGSRNPPLPVNGIANAATWAALDAAAGPVTVGREDFRWRERVEGTVYGGESRYTWRLQPDKLQVTVNIKFTHAPNHPMVTTWRNDIRNVWNSFRIIDEDHPGTSIPLEFVVGTGSPADATVRVRVEAPDVPNPGRSDAGNFYTSDPRHGMAAHEFGHLIGLRDEYNQAPEDLTIVTGEEPFVGDLAAPVDGSGNPVAPGTIAAEIRTAVTSSPANRRGGKAKAVVDKYGLAQGAFAQQVAQAYETTHAGALQREDLGPGGYHVANDPSGSMANDIAARIPDTSDAGEAGVTEVFLYSNRSIMGTMETVDSPISVHEHPVADRHLRHFAEIVGRNRPGTWRVST